MKRDNTMNQSLKRAFKIIELLASDESEELRITEISKKTELDISSTYRFLQTLEKLDLIEKNPVNKKYKLTLKLFSIGASVNNKRNKDMLNRTINEIKYLSKKYNESLNLSTFEKNCIIYIYKISTTHSIRYDITIGSRHPAYCTASGKIFLAYRDNKFFDSYVKKTKLIKYTPNTIVNIDDLKKGLETIRTKNYSIDREEYIRGVHCISAPIKELDGSVNFALIFAIPTIRLHLYKISDIIDDLLKSTNKISKINE